MFLGELKERYLAQRRKDTTASIIVPVIGSTVASGPHSGPYSDCASCRVRCADRPVVAGSTIKADTTKSNPAD